HGSREGDDVMLSGLLDRFDPSDVEGAALANVACGFRRHHVSCRHRFGGGGFNEEPRLVTSLVAPDATHFSVRVACDHEKCRREKTRRKGSSKPADISRARAGESNWFELPRPMRPLWCIARLF